MEQETFIRLLRQPVNMLVRRPVGMLTGSQTRGLPLDMPAHAPSDAEFRVTLDPDPRNTYSGSHCSDFGNYMAMTGVYDTAGTSHPGWAGATEFFPGVGKFKLNPTSSSQNVWECPCAPGIFYDSQSACESAPPCRPGLGGCLEKCGGSPGVCLTVTVKLPITGPIKISLLRWVPASPATPCQTAISTFDAAVLAHENHHKADAQKILAAAKNAPAKTFRVCAKTRQDAGVKLQQLVRKSVQDQVDAMSQAYSDSISAFHATPQGQPVLMDCTPC